MNIKIVGKDLKATEAIKEYIGKKLERIEKFISIDLLKSVYVETNIDSIKKSFNEEYYNENQLEFFKLSFDLFTEYPKQSFHSIWLKIKRMVLPVYPVHQIAIYVKDNIPLNITMWPVVNLPIAIEIFYLQIPN